MLRLSQRVNRNKSFSGEIEDIDASAISIVIPVKNNEYGILRFLKTFFTVVPIENFPVEIIIVDNNSDRPLRVDKSLPAKPVHIIVLRCSKAGPAAARNVGAQAARGDWILFCDSDCIPTRSLISGYLNPENRAVAYTGSVEPLRNTATSYFYGTERILMPHLKRNDKGQEVPIYLVTANCLVHRKTLLNSGGFNEAFTRAAGEDVELSIRLWQVGNLSTSFGSKVLHDFSDNLTDFCERFIRYGRGNWQLESIQSVNMKSVFRKPLVPSFSNNILKFLQVLSMSVGYSLEKIGTRE